jgi:hypothetical protein
MAAAMKHVIKLAPAYHMATENGEFRSVLPPTPLIEITSEPAASPNSSAMTAKKMYTIHPRNQYDNSNLKNSLNINAA